MPSAVVLFLCVWCVCASPAAPTGLRVEGVPTGAASGPTPVDFVHGTPRLSWVVPHTSRGGGQSAYNVVLRAEGSEEVVWDSGKVPGTDCFGVEAVGLPQTSDTLYTWQVRVWDADDQVSPFSERSAVLVPLIGDAAWQGAAWLGNPTQASPVNQFRKVITPAPAAGNLTRATCYVAGLGAHSTTLEGRPLANDTIFAQVVQWQNRTLYDAVDCLEHFQGRPSVTAAVTLGRWWFAKSGDYFYSPQFALPAGPRALRVLVALHFSDGTVQQFTTDPTWRQSPGLVFHDDLHMGEIQDGRQETLGWELAPFNDSAWAPATVLPAPPTTSALQVQTMPPIAAPAGAMHPVAVTHPSPGVFVYDLGREIAGRCRFDLGTGLKAGHAVNFTYGETLFDNGSVILSPPLPDRRTGGREVQINAYVARGAGSQPEVYDPMFYYTGFRYVSVVGLPQALPESAVSCLDFHTDFEEPGAVTFDAGGATGEPATAAATLTAVTAALRATSLANFVSLPTDCPSREKRGWLGDAVAGHLSVMHQFNTASAYRHFLNIIRDVATSALQKHYMPDIAPAIFFGSGRTNMGDPAWGAAYCLILHDLVSWYGDMRALKDHFQPCVAYVDVLLGQLNATTGVLDGTTPSTAYGDWCASPLSDPLESCEHADGILNTFYLIKQLDAISSGATRLNMTATASKYAALASSARLAFQKTYSRPDGTFVDANTPAHTPRIHSAPNNPPPLQTRSALAAALGLVLPGSAAANALATDVVNSHGNMVTGVTGSAYLFEALQASGRADLAFSLATSRATQSYFSMANHGTTLWEHWTGVAPNGTYVGGTLNHIMMGGSLHWLWSGLGGIRRAPGSFAWDRIVIQPVVLAPLASMTATTGTPRGAVAVAWTNHTVTTPSPPALLTLNVTVPETSTATVVVPVHFGLGAAAAVVTEAHGVVWNGPAGGFVPGVAGVVNATTTAGMEAVEVEVLSGVYYFVVTVGA